MSTVIPFSRPASARHGSWSQQELAEFYRVEAALLRAGFSIASEHGLSDEGEPWFVFCRPDGDAIIHFARIDGSYLVASDALDRPVRGTDFRTLIDQIARLHPDLLPIPAAGRGTTLVAHPAALLAALVAAAALSLSSEEAHAGPIAAGPDDASGPSNFRDAGPGPGHPQPSKATGDRETDRKQFEALILSAMIFAAEAMAADHGATGAELNLDLADQAGAALSHAASSDAAPALSAAPGSGRGSGSAAPPTVLTAPGSGGDPGSHAQPTSDGGAAGSRVDGGPAVRISVPGDMPKAPASQNPHPVQGVGSDVAPAATSTEASVTRTSGQQPATGGQVEAGTAASDGSVPEPSGRRADSASAAMAAPASQARSAGIASSDPFDAGIGAGKPAWIKAASETARGREAKTADPSEADDRGHGREAKDEDKAEVQPGKNPDGDGEGRGQSHADDVGQGRGASAETGPGKGPKADRDDPGDGPAGKMAKDQGAHEEAAAGDDRQAAHTRSGEGHANGAGRDGGSPAEATADDPQNAEPASSGKGHAKGAARDEKASARPASDDASPAGQTGEGGNGNAAAENRGSKAEAAAGDSPGAEQPDAEPAGRAHGKETAKDQSVRQPAEAASGDSSQNEPAGDGRKSGGGSQSEAAAQRETGSDTPAAAHGRASSAHADRGSAAQADAGTAGQDQGSDRADGHGSVPAGRSDHRGPQAQGPDAVDTISGQGRPASSDAPRSDAAPEAKDAKAAKSQAPNDPDPVDHGSNTNPAAEGPGGERAATDRGASGHESAADQASAPANGPAQDARSPSPDHARGGPSDHASGPDSAASRPSDDGASGGIGHDRHPSDVAAEPSSKAQADRAGDPAPHPQKGPAPHGAIASAPAAAPDAADRAAPTPTTAGDPAGSENQAGQGARAAADLPNASSAGEHGHGTDQIAASQSGSGALGKNAPIDPASAYPPAGQPGSETASQGAHGHALAASGRPSPPPAAIDATGNLVFHADAHQDPVRPAPAHGPEDAATQQTVGLVGIPDQPHSVHDLYHQT